MTPVHLIFPDRGKYDSGIPTYDDLVREQVMFIGPPELPHRAKMAPMQSPEDEAVMKQTRFQNMLCKSWSLEEYDPKTAVDKVRCKKHQRVPSLYAPEF